MIVLLGSAAVSLEVESPALKRAEHDHSEALISKLLCFLL
jgi:hypothetical protein